MASRRRYLEVLQALTSLGDRRKRRQVLLDTFVETDDEALASLIESVLDDMLRSRTNLRRTSLRDAPDIDTAALSQHCSRRIFSNTGLTSLVMSPSAGYWLN